MDLVVAMLISLRRVHTKDHEIIDEAIERLSTDERWAVDFSDGFRVEQLPGVVLATRKGRQIYRGRSVAAALRALVTAGVPASK